MESNSVLRRAPFRPTLRRLGIPPTRFLLTVDLNSQTMSVWENGRQRQLPTPDYRPMGKYRISSSKFGIGQTMDSNCTPLGLHRIAQKIGGGHPPGTVFRSRKAVGFTWQGLPAATIVHRIFRLEGLEPGFNRGGGVDSFDRYIYIHGFAEEATLGRPQSHGCIHLAALDLIPLYDWLPEGTLVWIHPS
jgi:lipoprotein-anchoring transpeptidase ErfK/SrfK